MAGFKETPRQKMIGMMYLVLTALLALNVSKEILDAFIIVNDSVEKTSQNFSSKITSLHEDFREQYLMNQDKVGPFYSKSEEAKILSQNLVNYIDSIKYVTIAKTEGVIFDSAKILNLAEMRRKDNYNDPTSFLVGGELKNGEGYVLMEKMNKYREAMLQLIPAKDRDLLNIGLETDGDYRTTSQLKQDWVQYNFYNTILAADVTLFNKMVNEVRNAEYDVVSHLYQGISKEDFKFSDIKAKVLPQSRYIFKGETYDAEVFLAAVDENSRPLMDYQMGASEWDESFVNSATHLDGDSGFVKLTINTSNLDTKEYTFAGRIGVKNPNGKIDYKEFQSSFIVAEPSANVAATKMNVFYRGVDNPITISAAGVPASKLKYDIVGDGKIVQKADGLYVSGLKSMAVQNVTINIYSETGNERKKLGEKLFRVRNLPKPDILVPGMDMDTESIAKSSFLVNSFLQCKLPEHVLFDYTYKVLSFDMEYVKDGDTRKRNSTSNRLTPDMKDIVQRMRSGSLVFRNIQVQGPTGPVPVKAFVLQIK